MGIAVGPVRAVAIHPSRPLLVSGGDDYKIKVWGESTYIPSSKVSLSYTSSCPDVLCLTFEIRHQTSKPSLSFHAAWSSRLHSYCSIPS